MVNVHDVAAFCHRWDKASIVERKEFLVRALENFPYVPKPDAEELAGLESRELTNRLARGALEYLADVL